MKPARVTIRKLLPACAAIQTSLIISQTYIAKEGGVMFLPTRVTGWESAGKIRLYSMNVQCIEDVLEMEPPVKNRFSNLSAEEISHMIAEKDYKYSQKVNVFLCLDQAVNHSRSIF